MSWLGYDIIHHDDGTSRISCSTCGKQSSDADDIYFRYCGRCGFLGDPIRQKWNGEGRATLLALCEMFGRYKRVVGPDRRTVHAVPTELISTEGLKPHEIHKFPRWTEEYDKTAPTDLPFERVEVVSTDGVMKLIITPRS